jgi:hypothetical protein
MRTLLRFCMMLLVIVGLAFTMMPKVSAASIDPKIPITSHHATNTIPVFPVKPYLPQANCQEGATRVITDPNGNIHYQVCNCHKEIVLNPPMVIKICDWEDTAEVNTQNTWINLNSGLYMDVEGPSTANGARVHQWTWTGGLNQWWDFYASGYGTSPVQAVSEYSGKCLGVGGGSTTEGAQIVQWGCNGNPDQSWYWVDTGYVTSTGWDIFNIVDYNSGMCIGIGGGSTAIGADAVQWPCDGSSNQMWF